MPAKPAIQSVAFSWLPGLVLQKMGRNEDSCTRRANDLEANYTFLKVCSWSWRFELTQPCLSCTYVICTISGEQILRMSLSISGATHQVGAVERHGSSEFAGKHAWRHTECWITCLLNQIQVFLLKGALYTSGGIKSQSFQLRSWHALF